MGRWVGGLVGRWVCVRAFVYVCVCVYVGGCVYVDGWMGLCVFV